MTELFRIYVRSGLMWGRAALWLPLIPTPVGGKISIDYWRHLTQKLHIHLLLFHEIILYCYAGDVLGALQRALAVLGPHIRQHESSPLFTILHQDALKEKQVWSTFLYCSDRGAATVRRSRSQSAVSSGRFCTGFLHLAFDGSALDSQPECD